MRHLTILSAALVGFLACSDDEPGGPAGDPGPGPGDSFTGGDQAVAGDNALPGDDATPGDSAVGDTAVGDTAVGDTAVGDTAVGDTAPPLARPQVNAVTPSGLCIAFTATEATVHGSGFLVIGSSLSSPTEVPTVTFGTSGDAPVVGATSCTTIAQPVVGFVCDELTVDLTPLISAGTFVAYDETIVVTNPAPGVASTPTPPVAIVTSVPPQITAVNPATACDTLEIDIVGTDFQRGAAINVSGATNLTIDESGVTPATGDTDTITVTFDSPLSPGLYSVTLDNPDGCFDNVGDNLVVEQAPFLFAVDRSVVFQGAQTPIQVYYRQGTSTLATVELIEDAIGIATALTWLAPPSDPYLVLTSVPRSLPEGSYELGITDASGCGATIASALFVEADIILTVDSIDPPFATQGEAQPVRITGASFVTLPRAYLIDTASSAAAVELEGVVQLDPDTITAVVRARDWADVPLAAGAYDVLVVSGDGSVGVLTGSGPGSGAFDVSAAGPPVVDSVSPTFTSSSADQPLTLRGGKFSPTVDVRFFCTDPTDVTTEVGGVMPQATPTQVTVTFPVATVGLVEGTICVIRVTNSTDGLYTEPDVISVGPPSGTGVGLSAAPPLTTARRAPAVEVGPVGSTDYVYVMGGDDGVGGALSSIEVMPLDRLGRPTTWTTLDSTLADTLTLAGSARIGRFLYVVGGNDISGPTETVWRSEILQPSLAPPVEAPLVTLNLNADGGPTAGLTPGAWRYRISALFDPGDPVNPSGESLPSLPIIARVPDFNPDDDGSGNDQNGAEVLLTWRHVDRAIGYRLYRAVGEVPTGDELLGDLNLSAFLSASELAALQPGDPLQLLSDAGAFGTTPISPLAAGALGQWVTFANLPGAGGADAAREGVTVAAAADPCNEPTLAPACTGIPNPNPIFHLYVAGGRDGNGVVRGTVNRLPIEVHPDDTQTAVGWGATAATLTTNVWQLAGFVVDWDSSPGAVAEHETWVYFGPGRGASNASSDVDAFRVGVGGSLGTGQAVAGRTQASAAYATMHGYLVMLGGERAGGAADARVFESEIRSPMPTLGSWTAGGSYILSEGRILPGGGRGRTHIFVVGGMVDDGFGGLVATTSVDVLQY